MKKIFKKFSTEIILIVLLFSVSFLVRSYKISDYLFFGFEQGRDAFVMEDIYTLKKFTLVGPKTDFGGIFHGPYFYYIISIPYFISKGNPIAVSYFLIFLNSFVPVITYILFKIFFKSSLWGFVCAFLVLLNFEVISYSRWLSNVSLALPFSTLSFFMLWNYVKKDQDAYFILSVLFAAIAAQFEIILLGQFIFVYIFLLFLKVIKIPGRKGLILSGISLILVFLPLIFFDLKHQFISSKSLMSIFTGQSNESQPLNIISAFSNYIKIFKDVLNRTFLNTDSGFISVLFVALTGLGIVCFLKYSKEELKKKKILFLGIWSLMTLATFPFGSGLDQSFVASIIGWIGVSVVSLKIIFKLKNMKIIFLTLIVLFLVGDIFGLSKLISNQGVFFVTVQNDLNLKDQLSALELIHADAKGEAYRFQAYTIPSLHPEGWEYLHRYIYPGEKFDRGKLTYIVIEKNVYPVWEKKWISDLGTTKLVWEDKIGGFRVQKRISE